MKKYLEMQGDYIRRKITTKSRISAHKVNGKFIYG